MQQISVKSRRTFTSSELHTQVSLAAQTKPHTNLSHDALLSRLPSLCRSSQTAGGQDGPEAGRRRGDGRVKRRKRFSFGLSLCCVSQKCRVLSMWSLLICINMNIDQNPACPQDGVRRFSRINPL